MFSRCHYYKPRNNEEYRKKLPLWFQKGARTSAYQLFLAIASGVWLSRGACLTPKVFAPAIQEAVSYWILSKLPPSSPSTPNRRWLRFGREMRLVRKISTDRLKTAGGSTRKERRFLSSRIRPGSGLPLLAWSHTCRGTAGREGAFLRREMRSNPVPPAHSGVLLLT